MSEIIYTSEEAKQKYSQASGSLFAAGMDLRAAIEAPMSILPSEQVMIPTGIKINMVPRNHDLSPRFAGLIVPRSGRGSKEGLVLGNTVGLIDQDYQGELMICAWARPTNGHINIGNARIGGTPIHIEPWERIAQLVFVPVFKPVFVEVSEFSAQTQRGEGGFGSTGKA